MGQAAPQSTTRRALFGAAVSLPAIAAVAALPAISQAAPIDKPVSRSPEFNREIGERYLCWLHTEMLAMQHHLGLQDGYVPMDRVESLWRSQDYRDGHEKRLEARAVGLLSAAGVSVQPDPDHILRRLGVWEAVELQRR